MRIFISLSFFVIVSASCTTVEELNEEQTIRINTALTPLTRSYRYEVSRAELLAPVLAQVSEDFLRERKRRQSAEQTSEAQPSESQTLRIIADTCSKAELIAAPYLDEAIKTQVMTAERTDETKPSEEAPAVGEKKALVTQESPEIRTCHQPIRVEGLHTNYYLYNAGSHRSRVLVREKADYLKRVPHAEYRLIRRVNLPQAEKIRKALAAGQPPLIL